MRRSSVLAFLVLLSGSRLVCQTTAPPDGTGASTVKPMDAGEATIQAPDLHRHLSFLASDDMKGRDTGSPEAKKAADYIAEHMEKFGLKPAGEKDGEYRARFAVPGRTCQNVCGLLVGTDSRLKKQCVVIGAHYDHVGLGMRGSRSPSGQGKIHNGADDNASGSSALLELMEAFAKKPTRRSLLFLAFSGEEMGLLGSKAWCKKPTVPLQSVVTMVNMDMVGRSRNKYLFVGGVNTGAGFEKIVRTLNEPFQFNLELNGGGKAPSDNESFYARKIPVLFFFTAEHGEYHTPNDDVPLINTVDQALITRLAYRVIRKLADTSRRPRFNADDRYAMPAASARGVNYVKSMLGIELGSPGPNGQGLVVTKVEGGGIGGASGLKAKDVLLTLDGFKADSFESVQSVLATRKKGSVIKVVIRRGSRKLSAKLTLR